MKIERAVREKTFTLTSIAGPSGSGKTYSAILYARGLVGPEGRIGFIDTENKRSRFYADVAGGFDVIDLDPPFTANRYVEAIKTFEDAGYTAIVIDSISHEWEGTGGVLEQAEAIEQATKKSGLHCWQKPKAAHKKLMNELLQTRAHIIFCCRVKEKVTQAKVNGKTEIVNEGFVVVQEKSFIYEMSVSLMLAEGSHVPTILKCPGDLLDAFPEGRKITVDVGSAVQRWSDQGVALDPNIEAAKREGLLAANEGTKALLEWWKGLGSRQAMLAGMKDTFKSIAAAADQLKTDVYEAGGGELRDRLAHARSSSDEGFDKSFVETETSALSDVNDVSDETASQGEAGADEVEAGHGDTASSAPEYSKLDCAKVFIRTAADNGLSDKDRAELLEQSKGFWREALPANSDFVGACFNTASKVAKGELGVNAATKYLEALAE